MTQILEHLFSNDPLKFQTGVILKSSEPQRKGAWLRLICTSQFHLRPAPPPPRADPQALAFFLPWMANSRGGGLLSCQIPRGGDEKRGQMPRPPSIRNV